MISVDDQTYPNGYKPFTAKSLLCPTLVLCLFALMPLACLLHFLICGLSFLFNALWLVYLHLFKSINCKMIHPHFVIKPMSVIQYTVIHNNF